MTILIITLNLLDNLNDSHHGRASMIFLGDEVHAGLKYPRIQQNS